jgi:hypothetical protein
MRSSREPIGRALCEPDGGLGATRGRDGGPGRRALGRAAAAQAGSPGAGRPNLGATSRRRLLGVPAPVGLVWETTEKLGAVGDLA